MVRNEHETAMADVSPMVTIHRYMRCHLRSVRRNMVSSKAETETLAEPVQQLDLGEIVHA